MLDVIVWTIRYRQLRVTCKWYKNKYNFNKKDAHKRVKWKNMNIQQINKIPRPLMGPPDSLGTTLAQYTVTIQEHHSY
jgi:hypothetical protein